MISTLMILLPRVPPSHPGSVATGHHERLCMAQFCVRVRADAALDCQAGVPTISLNFGWEGVWGEWGGGLIGVWRE